jgi:hypothetical protein
MKKPDKFTMPFQFGLAHISKDIQLLIDRTLENVDEEVTVNSMTEFEKIRSEEIIVRIELNMEDRHEFFDEFIKKVKNSSSLHLDTELIQESVKAWNEPAVTLENQYIHETEDIEFKIIGLGGIKYCLCEDGKVIHVEYDEMNDLFDKYKNEIGFCKEDLKKVITFL